MINRLGPTATAAHGVAIRCEALAFLTITAFSVAASTLTGQYLGAGRPDQAARAGRAAWALGVVVLVGLGGVLYLEAESLFALFLGGRQPHVAAMGVPVLRIVAFAMPALATITVLNGALRGAGDTRWPWLFVAVGYFAVRLPLTYVLTGSEASGGFGWGLQGAWIAMFVDLTSAPASWPHGSSREAGRRFACERSARPRGAQNMLNDARTSRSIAKRRSRFEVRKTDCKMPESSQRRSLPPVPSIRRCRRINLLRSELEISSTPAKSRISRIGVPSVGRAAAIWSATSRTVRSSKR